MAGATACIVRMGDTETGRAGRPTGSEGVFCALSTSVLTAMRLLDRHKPSSLRSAASPLEHVLPPFQALFHYTVV